MPKLLQVGNEELLIVIAGEKRALHVLILLNKLIAEQFWLLLCLGQDLINQLGNISVLLEQDNNLRQEVQPVIVYKHVTLSKDPIAEGYYAEFLEICMSLIFVMVWLQLFEGAVSHV